ncbi:MAG: hypothetical protein A2Y28_01885 [Chlamydiae bacterium GWC2_50_10]|nr:MAG: hypothetical protein A2Z85_00025 [Chlamydiae bacterium GWA2_50_15]OGN53636.1 MAG: hypothetical protein A2Y28_01885 [Chlamydiae bacterium GWC2_50_10]OGN54556.1 MAG: hypothetical protein A2098_00225 [Chlamydiae bacterium GWF2_49_8]OGN58893.1 MAG: hypothetical protein A3D18_01460 [Chlamydiae bacterium RIFCSPHIGHO2_02_FULL_49_29]OGN62470.1 MAG: hypothetical protein A3E26_03510 [Chlamydiae bacterium RIFCSPHIGHO2_12_FULL_49_32]OGN67798.1 MAG: hypothetical protein A3I15_03645 [Chlamydiae bact
MAFHLTSEAEGMKLLHFLKSECKESFSVKAIKRAIDSKRCYLNGRIETLSTRRLHSGDRIAIALALKRGENILSILYEDEHFLALNKPPGLVCDNRLIQKKFKRALKLIHRLDKETSGVLLLAKNERFREQMVLLFRQRRIAKSYYALASGSLMPQEGRCESFLARVGMRHGQVLWGSVEKEKGAFASTAWRVIKRTKIATFLELKPLTGRTHQLRVHLKELGHPLLGDVHYGNTSFLCPIQVSRNLLHAASLEFIHPQTLQKVGIQAPLPQDFQEALKELSRWPSSF